MLSLLNNSGCTSQCCVLREVKLTLKLRHHRLPLKDKPWSQKKVELPRRRPPESLQTFQGGVRKSVVLNPSQFKFAKIFTFQFAHNFAPMCTNSHFFSMLHFFVGWNPLLLGEPLREADGEAIKYR